jgi:hypothetical protein
MHYHMMDAHPLTVMIIIGTLMVTPFYFLATYVYSGASRTKGVKLAVVSLLLGAFMFWVCISDTPRRLGLLGDLIVPVAWILPSAILVLGRQWFLSEPLSQRWLVGLQLFRAIGAVFLVEMVRNNIPGIFAYPAGIGDVIAALVALAVLIRFRQCASMPGWAVWLVVAVGVGDFLSAIFFGFTSSETPLQLFHPAVPNHVIVFPTGMIPLFLVPYAIFFHTLSALNWMMHGKKQA